MTVHENIKKFRKDKGLTQKQLGELCNPKIAEANIRKYELGKANPKVETLERIAAALGVSLSDLYGERSNITSLFTGGSKADAILMKRAEEIIDKMLKTGTEMQGVTKDIAINTSEAMKNIGQYVSNSARSILEPYSKLNDEGKKKAVEYTTDLAQMKKYQKKDATPDEPNS